MSTKPRLQPTRRTVLRTAAWTAPAVSIAVAAPAFANNSLVSPPSATVTAGSAQKYSDKDVKHVRWALTLRNTGAVDLTSVYVVYTYVEASGSTASGLDVTSTSSVQSGTTEWSESVPTLTATYSLPVSK